jgi:hypothetical protein
MTDSRGNTTGSIVSSARISRFAIINSLAAALILVTASVSAAKPISYERFKQICEKGVPELVNSQFKGKRSTRRYLIAEMRKSTCNKKFYDMVDSHEEGTLKFMIYLTFTSGKFLEN